MAALEKVKTIAPMRKMSNNFGAGFDGEQPTRPRDSWQASWGGKRWRRGRSVWPQGRFIFGNVRESKRKRPFTEKIEDTAQRGLKDKLGYSQADDENERKGKGQEDLWLNDRSWQGRPGGAGNR